MIPMRVNTAAGIWHSPVYTAIRDFTAALVEIKVFRDISSIFLGYLEDRCGKLL
jgi:hypothetical protein